MMIDNKYASANITWLKKMAHQFYFCDKGLFSKSQQAAGPPASGNLTLSFVLVSLSTTLMDNPLSLLPDTQINIIKNKSKI